MNSTDQIAPMTAERIAEIGQRVIKLRAPWIHGKPRQVELEGMLLADIPDLCAALLAERAKVAVEVRHKNTARLEWKQAQDKLAEIERNLITITGNQTDYATNIDTLTAERDAALAKINELDDELTRERLQEIELVKGYRAALEIKGELLEALAVYADPRNFAEGNDWLWVGDDDPKATAIKAIARAGVDRTEKPEGKCT